MTRFPPIPEFPPAITTKSWDEIGVGDQIAYADDFARVQEIGRIAGSNDEIRVVLKYKYKRIESVEKGRSSVKLKLVI